MKRLTLALTLLGAVIYGLTIVLFIHSTQTTLLCRPTQMIAPEAQGLPQSQITPASYPAIYVCFPQEGAK